jgi:hypothetical protein
MIVTGLQPGGVFQAVVVLLFPVDVRHILTVVDVGQAVIGDEVQIVKIKQIELKL